MHEVGTVSPIVLTVQGGTAYTAHVSFLLCHSFLSPLEGLLLRKTFSGKGWTFK